MEEAISIADTAPLVGRNALKLLSFNIQTGVDTQDFHEYVTNRTLNDLPQLVSPRAMEVKGVFNVRGGIYTSVVARSGATSKLS